MDSSFAHRTFYLMDILICCFSVSFYNTGCIFHVRFLLCLYCFFLFLFVLIIVCISLIIFLLIIIYIVIIIIRITICLIFGSPADPMWKLMCYICQGRSHSPGYRTTYDSNQEHRTTHDPEYFPTFLHLLCHRLSVKWFS